MRTFFESSAAIASSVCARASAAISSSRFGRPEGLPDWPGANRPVCVLLAGAPLLVVVISPIEGPMFNSLAHLLSHLSLDRTSRGTPASGSGSGIHTRKSVLTQCERSYPSHGANQSASATRAGHSHHTTDVSGGTNRRSIRLTSLKGAPTR